MDLIRLVMYLALVGLFMWGINTYIPMQASIKKILNIVVVVVVVPCILSVFGILPGIDVLKMRS